MAFYHNHSVSLDTISKPPSYVSTEVNSENSAQSGRQSETKPKSKWRPQRAWKTIGSGLFATQRNRVIALIAISLAILIPVIVCAKVLAGRLQSTALVTVHTSGSSDLNEHQAKVRVIWAFDGSNAPLGSSDVDPVVVKQSQSKPVAIHQYVNHKSQIQYVDMIAGEDEICISWITAGTGTGSEEPWTWTCDVGADCGQAWDYSRKPVGGSNEEVRRRKCVWLAGSDETAFKNKTFHTKDRQMKINMFAYGVWARNETLDYRCGATIFSQDDKDPIEEPTPGGPRSQSRSSEKRTTYVQPIQGQPLRERSSKSASELVVNSRPDQSAIELCNSPTSRGSDFVSVDEGLFCDMEAKTLYPLCSTELQSHCFDVQHERLEMIKREDSGIQARGFRSYDRFVRVE